MQMEMSRRPQVLRALGVAVGTIAVVFSLATCDIFKVGLGAKVDIKAPVLSIGSPDQNEYRQGTIPVNGTISDDLTGVTLTVAYTGKGGPVSKTIPVTDNAWSVDLPSGNLAPADAEDLPEGERPVTFTARDATGKESEALLIVYVDNTAPTVLVTVPQSYGSPTVSDYIDIKGEAWDASPITSVRVRLLENDGLTPVAGLPEAEKTANGTNTWSVRFVVTPLAESVTPYKYTVTVTDKAGNASSYYYHSQDVWDLVEAGELFPAMDDIGRVDQTGTGSSQFTLDELDDFRHLETAPPIGGMKTFADFKKIDDATLPAIHFTSISTGDPVEENVVGTKVPISGYIEPGPAGNPVEGGSLRAWISPGAVAPTEAEWAGKPEVDATDVIWAAVGVSNISFQIEPKAAIPPAVTPDYIPSGAYWIRVAASAQSSLGTGTLTCGFLVDSSVPRFEQEDIAPRADSYVTRATFAGGTPLAGQTGIAIQVQPTDDNGLNPATFAAAAADITSGLPGTPLAAGWSGPAAGVWTVHIGVPDGATRVNLELEIKDVGGFIGRTSPALVFNIDETPPGVSIQSPGNYPGEEGSMLTGGSTTVSGTTDSDVQFVYVWLGLASATPPVYTAWPTKLEVAGNTSWVTLPLALATEGLYRVKARAVDFAGNPSPTEDSHDFYRDTGNPAVGETTLGGLPGQVLYRSAPFTLGGQAADSNSVAGVTVTQSKDGAPSTTVLDQALTGTNPAWTRAALPSPAADGTYEYLITATDVAGKTSRTVKRTVVYDTTPPVLSIDGITGGLTTLGKVNGTLTFKFSASDSLAGVEKDGANYRGWYRIVPDGTVVDTSAAAMAAWTPLTSAGILFTLDYDTTALGAAGDFDLYVGVRDTVTGTPNVSWHKTDLSIEQESDRPVIDFSDLTEGAAAAENPRGRNARILGTVGDDDGVDSALVQVRIDIDNDGDFADAYAVDLSTPPDGDTADRNETEAWQTVSNPTPGVTTLVSWMHDIGNLPQGVHRVQVRARDKLSASDAVYADADDYSWKTSGVESFFIDYGPPVLAITGPANGAIMTADFTITGTAADSYGMDTVTVSIDGAAPVDATSTSGAEFATWSYSFAVAGQNGTHSYQVKAIDDSGAETFADRQFVVDTTAPETSVETPLADQVTNGTLTLKGTAVENHQLANVYIHIGAQGAAAPDYRGPNATWNGGAGDDWTGWTALDQTYSWQHELDTVAQGDGDYTLHVRAIDAGGNVEPTPSTRDFSIDQASDRPVITVSTLKESGNYQENLLPATLQVAGTVSDDDLVKGGSIQVAVDRNNDGDFSGAGERDWATVSPAVIDGRVVTWANTFSGLTDGSHQLYVRAADTNDSGYGVYSSKQIGPVLFSVDTAPPAEERDLPGPGRLLEPEPR